MGPVCSKRRLSSESRNVKLMEHERLNEEALQTSEGNGYVIICSCGEVIEVPVGNITDGRARQLAIMKWHGHADGR